MSSEPECTKEKAAEIKKDIKRVARVRKQLWVLSRLIHFMTAVCAVISWFLLLYRMARYQVSRCFVWTRYLTPSYVLYRLQERSSRLVETIVTRNSSGMVVGTKDCLGWSRDTGCVAVWDGHTDTLVDVPETGTTMLSAISDRSVQPTPAGTTQYDAAIGKLPEDFGACELPSLTWDEIKALSDKEFAIYSAQFEKALQSPKSDEIVKQFESFVSSALADVGSCSLVSATKAKTKARKPAKKRSKARAKPVKKAKKAKIK